MTAADLKVSLGNLKLANPVMVASGTFGYGQDYQDLVELNRLGALVTKTITLKARSGNPPPRIAETDRGMLNSIGLENPGLEGFLREEMPFLRSLDIPVIVSVSADTPGEFAQLTGELDKVRGIAALELNISCPNLGKKGLIAQDAQAVSRVVKAARKKTHRPLITKLSPNVTDITTIARAAQQAGSDILALVNTFFGLAVDAASRRPKLGATSGGLSGPAIKPQALWMVDQVRRALKIPLIGMGGIMNTADALEFIICGASAVAVGTANFVNPRAAIEIIDGIERYLEKERLGTIKKLIGSLRR
ncbi:MAG: dihydroorotate dehydrogenase [Candidatus Omnitrophota bacterium]